MGNTNGTGPFENMRNLEHYLTDFMRGAGDAPDHLKGWYKWFVVGEGNSYSNDFNFKN